MKFFHNDKVSLVWAVLVEIAVHALFAFQAFLLGDFLGEIALVVVFGRIGGPIGAWAFAVFLFGAAFQAFVLGEYLREHVESFEATPRGDGSYLDSWKQVRFLVAAIEVVSLAFRCFAIAKDGNLIQAAIVLILGIVLLWYAFAQAKIIHASVNRPVAYDMNQVRQTAGRDIAQSAIEVIPQMSTEQKKRFYRGDLSAVDEVSQSRLQKEQEKINVKDDRENQKYQREQDKLNRKRQHELNKIAAQEKRREQQERRQREQEREYETGQDYTRKLLGDDPDTGPFLNAVPMDQADRNGDLN